MNTSSNVKDYLDMLKRQGELCEVWNDPEQWEALAMLYYQRGLFLNALHCFRRADACRQSVGAMEGMYE